jgi:hypothetical protein
MVTVLRRLTTEYVDIEDRIRISGQTPEDGRLVIWLTHRLAVRAIPKLLGWLESGKERTATSTRSSTTGSLEVKREMQSFAQAAAVAGLKPLKPITAQSDAHSWVIVAVDIKATDNRLNMTFRSAQEQAASVRFDATMLRQWLSIVHRAWSTAGWPPPIWPDWIGQDHSPPANAIRH